MHTRSGIGASKERSCERALVADIEVLLPPVVLLVFAGAMSIPLHGTARFERRKICARFFLHRLSKESGFNLFRNVLILYASQETCLPPCRVEAVRVSPGVTARALYKFTVVFLGCRVRFPVASYMLLCRLDGYMVRSCAPK
jgi:hypothetical protein